MAKFFDWFSSKFLGRYTPVIVTTVVFVVLVVGVLSVNFNLSYQTEANAEVVNIAGRQRMLSQRVAKSLGRVVAQYFDGASVSTSLAELENSSALFDRTLNAFKRGGTTQSTKSGEATLQAVSGAAGVEAVDQALLLWVPLYQSIVDLTPKLRGQTAENLQAELTKTQSYSDTNINTLLRLMNDLTNHSESLAQDAADQSRQIQTAGIIASLFCFAIILYLIFGQLQIADRAASAARQETSQIFDTVDQGLFLIDRNFSMGSAHSKALESIFSATSFEGRNFKAFISNLVSTDDLDKIERYLRLLFDPHKKQRLLKDLNPLNQLAIQVDEYGALSTKYLSFSFSRVMKDGEIDSVLSSVNDVTNEARLARELEAESRRNEQQLEMISVLMGTDSDMLPEFLRSSDDTYDKVNALLREPARTKSDFKDKADAMMSLVHKVKGESAALGLSLISDVCHEFEDRLQTLISKPSILGEDFLSLTVMLEQLMSTNEQIDAIFSALARHDKSSEKESRPLINQGMNQNLIQLVDEVAGRQNKKAVLSIAGFDGANVPKHIGLNLMSLSSQLLRNAVVHGIERPELRLSRRKPEAGQITIVLYDDGERGFRLVCEDDGAGIDFDALSSKARSLGLVSQDDTTIAPERLVNLLLTNRLSSLNEAQADQDSGRGVGLNVVSDLANKLNGRVAVQTKLGKGTRFSVRLPRQSQGASKNTHEVIVSV